MSTYPPSSLVDMYGVGGAASPVMESATPAMRLALDRQRILEFSLRHHHRHAPTGSAPTPAATTLLNPSAFCLPMVSIMGGEGGLYDGGEGGGAGHVKYKTLVQGHGTVP